MKKLWLRLLSLVLVAALIVSLCMFDFESMRFLTRQGRFALAYEGLTSAMDAGDYEEAEEKIEECLRYAGGKTEAGELADVYYRQGMIALLIREDNEAAIEALTHATEQEEGLAEAYLLRAQAEINLEQTEAAAEDVRAYIDLSGNTDGYETLGVIYETMGDRELAAEAYEQAGMTAAAVYLRALAAEEAGDNEAAAEGFELAAEDEDYTAVGGYNAGLCRMALGDYETAMTDFELSMASESFAEDALNNYVVCAMTLEQYDRALDTLNTVLGDDPEGSQSLYFRAVCETQMEEYEAAAEDFTRCIEADVLTDECTFNRALLYCTMEKYDEAIDDLTYCIESGYEADTCYYQRALVYAVLGDEEAYEADMAMVPEEAVL